VDYPTVVCIAVEGGATAHLDPQDLVEWMSIQSLRSATLRSSLNRQGRGGQTPWGFGGHRPEGR